ncbi:hypothetical protein QFZ75_001033 [Streptomyces sp. V3I8]|uniref:hypothetical protein n=1 Tax=Streptomyces sp. V3I8 TaxID=3042279 RepID=UPI002787389F|nr:hypothetical protein [Streptomyces sp. V3I8]MDQ1034617.1 hypothetical protein [Streptomyces sp. V3I8]
MVMADDGLSVLSGRNSQAVWLSPDRSHREGLRGGVHHQEVCGSCFVARHDVRDADRRRLDQVGTAGGPAHPGERQDDAGRAVPDGVQTGVGARAVGPPDAGRGVLRGVRVPLQGGDGRFGGAASLAQSRDPLPQRHERMSG